MDEQDLVEGIGRRRSSPRYLAVYRTPRTNHRHYQVGTVDDDLLPAATKTCDSTMSEALPPPKRSKLPLSSPSSLQQQQQPASSSVLSRMSLYTSMAAYNNPQGLDPSDFLRNQLSTPKTVQEAALIEFVARVSADFHRFSFGEKSQSGGRRDLESFSNRGGRPLSVQDVDESLRHRAITLVGGGFHSKAKQQQGQAIKSGGVGAAPFSERILEYQLEETYGKRRRCRRRPSSSRKPRGTLRAQVASVVHRTQLQFLIELNFQWIRYAQELLGTTQTQVSARLASLADRTSIEWVGAKVRVDQCSQQPSRLSGVVGILLRETPNTWRVVPVVEDDGVDVALDSKKSSFRSLRTLVVPKRGTVLTAVLPVQSDLNGDDALEPEAIGGSTIIYVQLRDTLAR